MAGMSGGRRMLRLRRWVVALGLGLLGPAALAQAPNPQIAAAQAVFESLPEAERKAIQTDLIWVGLLNSAASGGYGPLTFRAINHAKGGGPANGLLSATERQSLAQAALAVRDSVGFKLVTDERTGVRIGVPERILPKRETTPAGGSRWQSADGRITLDVSATPAAEPLEAIFQKATAANPNNPGRKITYKLLRPDFFVVSGETPTGKFYRRLALGPQGLRGFSIGYDKALSDSVDRLVIALASSFEPFPSGPAPSAGSTIASVTQPFVAPPLRPTERHGVALALTESVFVTSAAAIEGCRALRVASGPARLRLKDEASALALLESGLPVQAVISDMGRPPDEQAGYTLLDEMRHRGHSQPFLIFSRAPRPEHQEEAVRRGAVGTTDDFEVILGWLQREFLQRPAIKRAA